MKHRILYSYPARFVFLIGAAIAAGLILLVQFLRRSPAAILRVSN